MSVVHRWSKEEDEKLIRLVGLYGAKSWTKIARVLGSRVGKQCRERWRNHLDPNITHTPFTPTEDKQLMKLVREMGTRWSKICLVMPGRTENAAKNRYYSCLKKRFDIDVGKSVMVKNKVKATSKRKRVVRKTREIAKRSRKVRACEARSMEREAVDDEDGEGDEGDGTEVCEGKADDVEMEEMVTGVSVVARDSDGEDDEGERPRTITPTPVGTNTVVSHSPVTQRKATAIITHKIPAIQPSVRHMGRWGSQWFLPDAHPTHSIILTHFTPSPLHTHTSATPTQDRVHALDSEWRERLREELILCPKHQSLPSLSSLHVLHNT